MTQLDDQTRRRGPSLATKVSDILPEQVDEALHELRAEVLRLIGMEGAGSALKVARVQAWSEVVRGPLLPLLREAWRTREADVEQVLAEAKALPGLESAVVAFKKSLKLHAEAAKKNMRVIDADVDGRREQTFNIQDRQVTVSVPDGWVFNDDGAFQMKDRGDGTVALIRASDGPILVLRKFAEAGGGQDAFVEIAWRAPFEPWKVRKVPMGQIKLARELCTLAHKGVPVDSEKAGLTVQWLAAFMRVNQVRQGWMSAHMGWQGRKHGHFLIGQQLLAANDSRQDIELLDDGAETSGLLQMARALRPKGTWEGWLQGVARVADRPLAWAAIYASCASPLLAILDCDSWFLDYHCPTGGGKSKSLRLAGSVWGDPGDGKGLKRSWNNSVTGAEQAAAALCSIPLLLDETNVVPDKDRPKVSSMIYMLANSDGKGRGTPKGGTGGRATETWNLVIVSTGEQSAKSFTNDAGLHGRMVSLYGPPMGSAEQAEQLERDLRQHHGHLGRRLVEVLVQMDEDERDALRDRYHALVTQIGAAASSSIGRRVAQYLATMQIAADLVHDRCGVPRPAVDPMPVICKLADRDAAGGDKAREAMAAVWGWAMAHTGQMATGGGPSCKQKPEGSGWVGRYDSEQQQQWCALYPHIVEEQLIRRGHAPKAIIQQWVERGWLMARRGKTTHSCKMPGSPVNLEMYAAKLSSLVEVGLIDDQD